MTTVDEAEAFDVAVVGFGPSGAVAAALLGQAGLRTLVVDRVDDVYDRPRAIALDHEIMRVFQQLGMVEKVAPWCEPFTPSEYYGVDKQLIKRLATVEPPYPLGYTPSLVFSQPPVEKALREHVASLPSVEVSLGNEFTGFSQDKDKVTLNLRTRDGTSKRVEARYMIGCDGASSSVREKAGIKLEDLGFDEPWLVVDVLVNEKGLAKLPNVSVQYCEPSRPCTYVIGTGNHRRWEISLLPGEDPQYMATEAGAWSVLSRWITPEDGQLWRQASYRFHALVAQEWRKGRVFIAGDAAHQQPPFLGQGMCQGVRDVANLTWKLRTVLAGQGGEALLDSYGEERGLHVKRLTARIKEIGKLICERDPDAARIRDTRLLAEAGGTIRTIARQDIIPPLEAGLLSPQSHAARGTLFPQPKILSGNGEALLDHATGTGWRIVMSESLLQQSAAVRQLFAPLGTLVIVQQPGQKSSRGESDGMISVIETEGVVYNWFARNKCIGAIVRPDHYVYGVAEDEESMILQLRALMRQLDASSEEVVKEAVQH